MSNATQELDWPAERAAPLPDDESALTLPGSNVALDFHGDPLRARLVVFSDGNHHMALEASLQAFLQANSDCRDIFYVTTPPRIIVNALSSGQLSTGNLSLTVSPHVMISPDAILAELHHKQQIGAPVPFMRSDGLAILVRRGNPCRIRLPVDLLGGDIRLALSNPVTEKASWTVYASALLAAAEAAGQPRDATIERLESAEVIKSQFIHHREIPALLANNLADASLVYRHLALRYCRIFPRTFDHIVVDLTAFNEPARYLSHYHAAVVGDGGSHGQALLQFLQTDLIRQIYRSHGLQAP